MTADSMPDIERPGSGYPAMPHDAGEVTVIRPARGWAPLGLRELWEYRELLYFLVWSDIRVRYKQTVLGAAWAIIQPFFTMVVFSIFFGRLAGIPSNGVPYPVFAYVGLVPWSYFAGALSTSSTSLVARQGLITKVYFPRVVVPLASVLAGLVDLAIAFIVLIGLMLVYGIRPGIWLLTVPVFVLIAVATALSVSLWLSTLAVQFRDVRYVVPFLVQVWLFATPVAYPASLVPEQWRVAYGLNPMVGVIEGFRWALLGQPLSSLPMLIVSVGVVLILLVGGLFYFGRMEQSIVDVV